MRNIGRYKGPGSSVSPPPCCPGQRSQVSETLLAITSSWDLTLTFRVQKSCQLA
jgi:hypothetical protein